MTIGEWFEANNLRGERDKANFDISIQVALGVLNTDLSAALWGNPDVPYPHTISSGLRSRSRSSDEPRRWPRRKVPRAHARLESAHVLAVAREGPAYRRDVGHAQRRGFRPWPRGHAGRGDTARYLARVWCVWGAGGTRRKSGLGDRIKLGDGDGCRVAVPPWARKGPSLS